MAAKMAQMGNASQGPSAAGWGKGKMAYPSGGVLSSKMKKCWYKVPLSPFTWHRTSKSLNTESRTERQSHCLKETGLGKPHLYVDSGDGVQLMPLESK